MVTGMRQRRKYTNALRHFRSSVNSRVWKSIMSSLTPEQLRLMHRAVGAPHTEDRLVALIAVLSECDVAVAASATEGSYDAS